MLSALLIHSEILLENTFRLYELTMKSVLYLFTETFLIAR